MAAVDPKELAQRNVPLLVLYGIALLAIPAYFIVVQGGVVGDARTKGTVEYGLKQLKTKKSTLTSLAGRIDANSPEDPVYNQNYTEYFTQRADQLRKQNGELIKLVAEKDKALESWPEKFGGEPQNFSDYQEYWNRVALPALAEEFKDMVSDPADPERTFLHDDEPTNRNKMAFAQKRFWAQKYILSAIKEGGQNGFVVGEGENRKTVPAQLQERIMVVEPKTTGGRDGDDLPLVTSFQVRVTMRCSFRDLSAILTKVVSQPIPLQVRSFEVSKAPFQIADNDIRLRVDGSDGYFTDDNYSILLDKIATDFKGEDKLEDYIPEPPVLVTLEVDVLDFNPPKVKEPAPQPAGE